MIREQIQKLENIIDSEINGYQHIEKLYVDKKELLIKGKADSLHAIDEQIMNTYKNISSCAEERKQVSASMNLPSFSLTDIINKVKENDEQKAQKFEEKKATVNELAQKIYQLERTNIELLKHGMHVTNKTLEIIIKGLKPITNEYDKKGQNIAKQHLEMSSIIEEA